MNARLKLLALRSYGIGMMLTCSTVFPFLLQTYGQGGVPEYRGRMGSLDEYFPDGVDHILFNHGAVTPITPGYFTLIESTERFSLWVYVLALPLLLWGLAAYWTELPSPHTRSDRMRLGFNLWVPDRSEPILTSVAKFGFLFLFATLFLSDFQSEPVRALSPDAEHGFIMHTICTFVVVWTLAIAAAMILRWYVTTSKSRHL